MGFGDLNSQTGKQSLNNFLADKSYIEGFQPSQGDAVVFSAMSGAPDASLCHALRWFNHIKSYSQSERSGFPGRKKDVQSYGPKKVVSDDSDSDEDEDLFGSDSDEESKAKREEQKKKLLEAYHAKKAKKPGPIAKSSVIIDVKPWDDETDMKDVEAKVRTIEMDGLLWGAAKLVPVGYGIKKLQITMVIEDDKVSTEDVEERIQAFEDLVQSTDIAAFNKI